jgi:hypothetical protein
MGSVIGMIVWTAGLVVAKGIMQTTLCVFLPPYAFYLIIERILLINGLI